MLRYQAALFILLLGIPGCVISAPHQAVSAGTAQKGLYWETISPTVGSAHLHGYQFMDPEDIVARGPITSVEVHHAGYIHGIRLTYGRDGIGNFHGLQYGQKTIWKVPDGEKIVRVEGEYGSYLTQLQFFTDGGNGSPVFGMTRATRFAVTDPAGGALRTMSGWANVERHKARNRALVCLTLHFGAPYFIKEIKYDPALLDAAKLKAAPYQVARMELPNKSSLEQQVVYQQKKTIATEKTLTFEQSLGLKLGGSISAGLTAGLKMEAEAKWEISAAANFGQSYKNSSSQEISWSIPVKVPPYSKVVAVSTMRRYKASIPFTYTVAWYEGSKDNIKKEVTLPGIYEGTQIEDLQHEFLEVPLESSSANKRPQQEASP
jgi:hypothetical protein